MRRDPVELEQAPVIHGLLAYVIVAAYGTIITNYVGNTIGRVRP